MRQFSFFDGRKNFKIEKPIRLIELFAGIGSQAKALENLGANFESWFVCEKDEYCINSYNAIHGTKYETSDIKNLKAKDLNIVDTENFCYVLTYSFPCVDISTCGRQKGINKEEETDSGLIWEVERIMCELEVLPQVLLLENVPQLFSGENIKNFSFFISKLEKLGYKNYWKVLNSLDYGVPQDRKRVFMVSLLGDYYYDFPKAIPLKTKMKDLLLENVAEKYYVSKKGVEYIFKRADYYSRVLTEKDEFLPCAITANGNFNWTGNFICELKKEISKGIQNKALAEIVDKIELEKTLALDTYNQITHEDYFQTIRASIGNRNADYLYENYAIRKLCPQECFRFMGFSDKDFMKASGIGTSDFQLYKQAGNSIVVDVLMAIFNNLLGATK